MRLALVPADRVRLGYDGARFVPSAHQAASYDDSAQEFGLPCVRGRGPQTMSYVLEAVVGRTDQMLFYIAGLDAARLAPLRQGLSLLPIADEVLPTIRKTNGQYVMPGSKAELDLLDPIRITVHSDQICREAGQVEVFPLRSTAFRRLAVSRKIAGQIDILVTEGCLSQLSNRQIGLGLLVRGVLGVLPRLREGDYRQLSGGLD